MAEMEKAERPRVVVLVGPTGVGKSGLALELVQEVGGEIVTADSMQVYKYMDIGTAKPTLAEQQTVKHHLIDVVNPDQLFHAGLYRALGRKAIDDLSQSRRPIWLVGGTGLYIKTLTQGLFSSPKIDPTVRKQLKQEATEEGAEALYQRLVQVDFRTAAKLHPHDLIRTLRALEVFESTGIPISFYHDQHCFGDRPYRTLKIGLEMPRQALYDRLDERVERMIAQGFLREVENLLDMGYGPDLKPMQSLGYKQLVQVLSKKIGWDEAIRQIKRDTRHYAKRQWTWFKADPEVVWWNPLVDRPRVVQQIGGFLGGG